MCTSKDHLGNVRLSYQDANQNNSNPVSLEILEENNYYPFGLKHSGYNSNPITNHPYKYNGKELNEELGLDWYDFGARNYDPALGRWMNIDPLAENSRRWTPYNFAYNNPIYFVDPDGMQADDWKTNAQGVLEYDKDLTKENAATQLKEGETYVGESFVGVDQDSSLFFFNKDGTVTDTGMTSAMWESAGADPSGFVEITSTVVEKEGAAKETFLAGTAVALATTQADSPFPGPADLLGAILQISVISKTMVDALSPPTTLEFAKTKPGKAAEVEGAEHTSNARNSTKQTHQKGQTRKQQVNRDKKRQNPNWKQR